MLARVMLLLLFLGGVAMVIAGITISVDATHYSLDEAIRWPYTITGWILMGLGVVLALFSTLIALAIAIFGSKRTQ